MYENQLRLPTQNWLKNDDFINNFYGFLNNVLSHYKTGLSVKFQKKKQ